MPTQLKEASEWLV